MKKYTFIIFLSLVTSLIFAQDPMIIGPFGGYNYNILRGNLETKFENVICDNFQNGKGYSPFAGVKMFNGLTKDINYSMSLYYNKVNSNYRNENSFPVLDPHNNLVYMKTENNLNVNLNYLTFNLTISPKILDQLYMAIGPSASILLSKTMNQEEKIINPTNISFMDGTRSKEIFRGNMDLYKTIIFSALYSIGIVIPLSDNIFLNPEISYKFPLNKIDNNDNIFSNNVNASIGLLFKINNNREKVFTADGCECKLNERLDGFYIGLSGFIPFGIGLQAEYRYNNWGFLGTLQYLPDVGKLDDTPPPDYLAKYNHSEDIIGAVIYHLPELCTLQPFFGFFGGISFRHFKKPIKNEFDIQSGNFIHHYFGFGAGVKFYFSDRLFLEEAIGLGIKSAHNIPSEDFFAYKLYFFPWIAVGYRI